MLVFCVWLHLLSHKWEAGQLNRSSSDVEIKTKGSPQVHRFNFAIQIFRSVLDQWIINMRMKTGLVSFYHSVKSKCVALYSFEKNVASPSASIGSSEQNRGRERKTIMGTVSPPLIRLIVRSDETMKLAERFFFISVCPSSDRRSWLILKIKWKRAMIVLVFTYQNLSVALKDDKEEKQFETIVGLNDDQNWPKYLTNITKFTPSMPEYGTHSSWFIQTVLGNVSRWFEFNGEHAISFATYQSQPSETSSTKQISPSPLLFTTS